jgi:DNA-binding MarR family transcriptional regulator
MPPTDSDAASTAVLEQLQALVFAMRSASHRAGRDAALPVNPSEVRALLHISHAPGCTASDLVRQSGRDKAQVARLIQQLESQGLARREPDAQDRRIQRLYTTDAGEQLHRQLHAQRDALARQMLAVLSPAEQTQLASLLAKLLSTVDRGDAPSAA